MKEKRVLCSCQIKRQEDFTMKQNQTELAFILDRSGSMCGLEADTIGDHNASLLRTFGRWMEKPDRAGFQE
jgi:hypothetical protein